MGYVPSTLLGKIVRHQVEAQYVTVGHLSMPTGQVLACDPLVYLDGPAFERTVSPGTYPVEVVVIDFEPEQKYYTVAAAILRFSTSLPERFEMAVISGQDTRTLEANQIFGHPVDGGMSCFADLEAAALVVQRDKELSQDPDYISFYDNFIYQAMEANHNHNWLDLRPYPDNLLNVIVFSSGYGDGFYASYWGFDAGNQICCLVTDLGVLE